MATISQRLKGYYKENKQAQEEVDQETVRWMSLQDLRKERVAFGTAKKGLLFTEAFKDHGWTDWFVANYESSKKPEHHKYVRFVELTLNEEMEMEAKGGGKKKTDPPSVMTAKPKMTAAKTKPKAAASAASAASDTASWTPVEGEESEPDLDFAVDHLEEEVIMVRAESREVNHRLTNLEAVMQEVISHLKQFQVKTEQ